MNTEFEKQLAVCDHYRKKTDFWCFIMWALVISSFIAILMDWDRIWFATTVVYLVAFIPAWVRMWQYGRAVDKLGKKDDK